MLAPMVQARTAEGREALKYDTGANQLRVDFNALQDIIQVRIAEGQCPDVLHEIRRATGNVFEIASQHGLLPAQERLQTLHKELLHSELRLEELCKHAMDESDVQALAFQLSRGAEYQLGQLHDKGRVMGWTLVAYPYAS